MLAECACAGAGGAIIMIRGLDVLMIFNTLGHCAVLASLFIAAQTWSLTLVF